MKHRSKNIYALLVILASLLLLFVGCSDMMAKMGEIALTIELENVGVEVSGYTIVGELAGGRSPFTWEDLTGTSHSFPDLTAGDWTFTVTAFDGTGQVGSGKKAVRLTAGQVSQQTILVVFGQPDIRDGALVPAAPSRFDNPGKVSGTTDTMEYRLASLGDDAYTACTGDETDLEAGTYLFRRAERRGLKAGAPLEVTVPAYVPMQLTIAEPELALSRAYDGSTSVVVTAGLLGNVRSDEEVSVTASASYNDKTAGAGKTITVVYTLGDTSDAGNYLKPADKTFVGEITKKPLGISEPLFPEGKDRVYTGDTSLAVTAGSLIGLATDDVVSVSATAMYADKNVGTGTTITVTYTLSGSDKDNYSKPADNTSYAGDISRKGLSFTVTAADKIYDGDAKTSGSITLIGVVGSDDVSADGTFTFSDKNVGSAKAVSVTGITLSGAQAGNYSLWTTESSATATIIKKTFDMSGITFEGSSITYDRNAHPLAISGSLPDGVTVSYSDNNTSTQAGTYVVCASFSGDATNCDLIEPKEATLTIRKRILTSEGTYPTLSKAYDKNLIAQVSIDQMLSGKVAGDAIVMTAEAYYAGVSAGSQEITVSYTLTGNDIHNYTKPEAYTVPGEIRPIQLEIGNPALVASKAYDGDVSVVVTKGTLRGFLAGDGVSVNATAAYADKNVGTGKAITVSYALDAPNANYLAPVDYTTYNGLITGKSLAVASGSTLVEPTKVYDGSLSSTVTNTGTLEGKVSGDTVELEATASYTNRGQGSDKAITVRYTLSGSDSRNYLAPGNGVATGAITRKALTVKHGTTQITLDKLFDDNATAEVTAPGTPVGVVGTDSVTLGASASYNDGTPGESKAMTVVYSLGGADADNYTAPASDSTSFTGRIGNRQLIIADPILVRTKVYESSDTCIVFPGNPVGGIVGSDNVQVQATATYDTRHAGTGKTITVVYSLTGRDAGKYTAPENYVAYDGEIQQKQLSMTAPTIPSTSKPYDGNTSVEYTAGTVSGRYSTDNVAVETNGYYLSPTVDIDKRIFFTYILLGSDATNYIRPDYDVVYGASITRKHLSVSPGTTVVVSEKTYDKSTSALVTAPGTLIGIVGSEEVSLGATAAYENARAGDKDITVTYSLSGKDAAKYMAPASYTITTGRILQKPLGISEPLFPEGKDRVYTGDTSLAVTAGSLIGVEAGDNVTPIATAMYADKNASATTRAITVAYTLSGPDKGNYSNPADTIGNSGFISKKVIDMSGVTFTDRTVMYSGESHFLTLAGAVPAGIETSQIGKKDVGSHTITIDFIEGDSTNYRASPTFTTATLTILQKVLTVSPVAASKVYNGSVATSGTLSLSGVIDSDVSRVNVSCESFTFEHPHVGDNKTVIVSGIYLSGGGASNYTIAETATAHATISKAVLTASVGDYSKTYGQENPAFGVSVAGFVNGESTSTAAGYVEPTASSVANALSSVGTSPIIITGGSATNYSFITTDKGILTINKATYDMGGIGFAGKTITYDGYTHQLSITGPLPSGVTVSYSNNMNISAGSYEVTASFSGNTTNYNAIPSKKATITINKAALGGTVSITGIANVGMVLTANTSSLTNMGDLSYQWLRNGSPIASATSKTYTVVPADKDTRISVVVSSGGTNYTGSKTSNQTAPVTDISLGKSYGGGIVAYIYQLGDPTYVSGELHGLIISTADQGAARWDLDFWPEIPINLTSDLLGSGLTNTNAIIAAQGEPRANYAAGLARSYRGGGYDDWFLPSKQELNVLYLNQDYFGRFLKYEKYWSSSESTQPGYSSVRYASARQNSVDFEFVDYKYNVSIVRPVRYF